MNQDINRLLMELERTIRAVNREAINPVIPELSIDGLAPVLRLVADARARYLRALVDLGTSAKQQPPTEAQLDEIAKRRREYDDLVSGAKALEVAIQRGYLDILPSRR